MSVETGLNFSDFVVTDTDGHELTGVVSRDSLLLRLTTYEDSRCLTVDLCRGDTRRLIEALRQVETKMADDPIEVER